MSRYGHVRRNATSLPCITNDGHTAGRDTPVIASMGIRMRDMRYQGRLCMSCFTRSRPKHIGTAPDNVPTRNTSSINFAALNGLV